jgi:hypothetical protein
MLSISPILYGYRIYIVLTILGIYFIPNTPLLYQVLILVLRMLNSCIL